MPKVKPKRISGTGYSKSDASRLLYKKQSKDGTWEIDVEAIRTKIDNYIDEGKRTREVHKKVYNAKLGKLVEWDEEVIDPISMAGLRMTLKPGMNPETLDLWSKGYVNRDHMTDDKMACNEALSEVVREGINAVARYMSEDTTTGSVQTKYIRGLESIGELAPSKQSFDVSVSSGKGIGKFSKWAK